MFEILYSMEREVKEATSEVCTNIYYGFLWIICGRLIYVGIE